MKRTHPGALAPFAALASSILSTSVLAADLTVSVEGVRAGEGAAKGPVKVMLFDQEEGFRKEDKARQVLAVPASGEVVATFRDLRPGRYAVIAYHDENGDGKLNLRFGMFPKEGYVVSNNPKFSGPPKFDGAAFDLPAAGLRIGIRLAY